MEDFLASPIAYFGIDEYVFNSAVLGAVAGLLGSEVGTVAAPRGLAPASSAVHGLHKGNRCFATTGGLGQVSPNHSGICDCQAGRSWEGEGWPRVQPKARCTLLAESTSSASATTQRTQAPSDRLVARLVKVTELARDTKLYEFARTDGLGLAQATAGSHVDVFLPNGLIRQYSLVLGCSPSSNYTLAVKDDPKSRGGSRYMHHELRVGAELEISLPRNHFPLFESASHTVLIAGGIGITPILSMLNRLRHIGRSLELHYACRSREDMAFFEVLKADPSANLHLDDDRGAILDLDLIRKSARPESHFYCCGPLPMLEAFERSMQGVPSDRVHLEYFSPKSLLAVRGDFEIELARTKRILVVKSEERIVDVLLAAGVNVSLSCEQGICGSCETRVLAGTPDHRDQILTDAERREGKSMMICCSRALSDRLVLDI